MKPSVIILLIAALLLPGTTVLGASTLERMSASRSRDQVQVFLSFDQLPRYDQKLVERRLDIILNDTVPAENLTVFDQDETIVKILTIARDDATLISFFFRYPPQKIDFSTGADTTLVIDILPGNRFTKTYEELSRQLSGITILERETDDFANPLLSSRYAHNWKSFFSFYETEVSIDAPIRFTIPGFPLVAAILPRNRSHQDLLGERLLELADRQAWAEMAPLLDEQLQTVIDIETGKYLAVVYAEVLLRTDHFEGAYKQLYLLKHNYPQDQVGVLATYLMALLLAVNDDPFTADFELRSLSEKIPASHPLAPHYLITLAETSLATRQLDQMHSVLDRKDVAYPPELLSIRELRQADLLHATGHSVQAFVTYRLLPKESGLKNRPFSLNASCTTLYEQKMWEESGACYRELGTLLPDREHLGMASFRSTMAQFHQGGAAAEIISQLSRIEDTFPNTEAAFRAALKYTDLRYLGDPTWHVTAKSYYRELAEQSRYRAVSEEAYFKEALLYHLHTDDATAIPLLMTLTRNFRSGQIVPHAEALLLQILPGEIRRLINAGNHLEAVVLSRQNRRFFDNNWIDADLLVDLALAHERLGSFQEALNLYLFLAGRTAGSEKEQFYLPLARTAFAKGDFNLVEDFAGQYAFNFPDGRYRNDILLLRLKSLYATDQSERAIDLLPAPLPDRSDFKSLAATLFFTAQNFDAAANLLEELANQPETFSEAQVYMRAESLFQLERYPESAELFQQSRSMDGYQGQSVYRLSQIARSQGNQEQALNLLKELAETTDDSLWQQLARKELQANRLISQ
jgi:hypothetical protein